MFEQELIIILNHLLVQAIALTMTAGIIVRMVSTSVARLIQAIEGQPLIEVIDNREKVNDGDVQP